VGKHKENRTLGSCRHRWEDNIKWVLRSVMGHILDLSVLGIGTNGGLCDWINECFAA
jgi:hypothetical protein